MDIFPWKVKDKKKKFRLTYIWIIATIRILLLIAIIVFIKIAYDNGHLIGLFK